MGTGSIAYDVVNRKKRRDYEKKTKEYWENLKNYR